MEEAAADQGDVPLFIRQAKEQADAAEAAAATVAAAGGAVGCDDASISYLTASSSSGNSSSASISHAGSSPASSSSWLASPLHGTSEVRMSGPGWYLLPQPKMQQQRPAAHQLLQQHQHQQHYINGYFEVPVDSTSMVSAQPALQQAVPDLHLVNHLQQQQHTDVYAGALPLSSAMQGALSACVPVGLADSSGAFSSSSSGTHDDRVMLRQALERQLQKQQQHLQQLQQQPQLSMAQSAGHVSLMPAAVDAAHAPHSMAMQLVQQQQLYGVAGSSTGGHMEGATVQVLHMPPMPAASQQVLAPSMLSGPQQQRQQPLQPHAQQTPVSVAASSGGFMLLQSPQALQPQHTGVPVGVASSMAPAVGVGQPSSVAYTTSMIGYNVSARQQLQQQQQPPAVHAGGVPHAYGMAAAADWQQAGMPHGAASLLRQQQQMHLQQQPQQPDVAATMGMLTHMLQSGALQLA